LTINNTSIDVTTPNCSTPGGILWRSSLYGLKSVDVSGDGFFEDSTAELRANTIAMQTDNKVNMEIVVPDFGTYSGAFRITTLEYGGETEGGVTYSLALESTDAISFAAS
ncbi:MAG: phage tail tube protein, partial [Acidiferrobacterales bacterium]